MYKLPIKNNDEAIGFEKLEALLNFIKLGEYAYGAPDLIRSPSLNDSVQSIHSAYEVQEDSNNSLSNDTQLESELSGYTTPESLYTESSASSIDGTSTTSGSFSLPPSENQILLSGLLKRVSTTSNESIASSCFDTFNSSKTMDKNYGRNTSRRSDNDQNRAADSYNLMKTASFDDKEIAQVVHDLVFEKYEESYTRLLNKLKKLHLTEEEDRYRSVVVELEGVLTKNNPNLPNRHSEDDINTPDSLKTCPVDIPHLEKASTSRNIQIKNFEGLDKIYSSTDSELEHDVKPIGIPLSGKLDKTFTITTCSTVVNMEPVDRHEDNIKNSSSTNLKSPSKECALQHVQDDITDLHKYKAVPHVTEKNMPCPVFNVETKVYAFNVDNHPGQSATTEARRQRLLDKRKTYNKSLDLHDVIQNLDQTEEVTPLNPPPSPLARTVTTQSCESEYNEYNFLRAALGDELLEGTSSNEYLFPQTVSIATDDISELLSSTSSIAQSRRRRCRNRPFAETISYDKKSLSLCNTVLQKETTNHKKASTINGSESYASYEDITNFSQAVSTNQGKKLIKNKIFVNETIIDQTERALEYGQRKVRGFVGSPAHLEAERTLLVSKIRRQAFINTLYTIQETPSEIFGRITIENLRCSLNTIRNNHHLPEQYYVCVLQHKTTVYSTRIAAPNRLGCIDFGGCFIFDNVANTFSIKIEMYAIQLSQVSQNCLILPFFRSASKLPMMKLIGETHIGIMNRKSERFSLIYRDGERFSEHKLSASIQTSIKWPQTIRGFLTIGIEKQDCQPIWNRRWCVLEDAKLKYYNYPSDENYCKPVGTLDLDTCKCYDETYRRYLRQKTLALFIDSGNDFQIYYLSPDTTEEFDLWHKNVEVVLRLIKEWNMF